MEIVNYHVRFPGPFERQRTALQIIYYVVRIVYISILIVATLMALGGIAA